MVGSLENFALQNIKDGRDKMHKLSNPSYLEKMSRFAEEQAEEYELDMASFINISCSKAEVEKDNARVRDIEKSFKKNNGYKSKEMVSVEERNKTISKIFENFLMVQIDVNATLGGISSIKKTTLYDDYINHVDCVMSLGDGDAVGLSVDVVLVSEEQNGSVSFLESDTKANSRVEDKIKHIESLIEEGKMTNIKYFPFENRKPTQVVKVVLGVDSRTLENVCVSWEKKHNKVLAYHPFRFMIFDELIKQLEYFSSYSESCYDDFKDDPIKEPKYLKMMEEYKKMLNIFQDRYEDDREVLEKIKGVDSDFYKEKYKSTEDIGDQGDILRNYKKMLKEDYIFNFMQSLEYRTRSVKK